MGDQRCIGGDRWCNCRRPMTHGCMFRGCSSHVRTGPAERRVEDRPQLAITDFGRLASDKFRAPDSPPTRRRTTTQGEIEG